MSIIGMIVMLIFAAVAIAILNNGVMDKKYKRRAAYWTRFEGK
jgi:hypothetical protein